MRPRLPNSAFVIASCLALGALLAFASGTAGAQEASPRDRVIRVGVEVDARPYVFANSQGQPAGYGIDLLQAVARQTGLTLQFQVDTWQHLRTLLEKGQIDVVPLMAKTPERARFVDFSDPHIDAYDAVFVRTDNTEIHSQDDLRGRRVIVQQGDLAQEYLERRGQSRIVLADTIPSAMSLLSAGQGDALVASEVIGLLTINKLGIKDIHLAQNPHFGDYKREFAFAVAKGHRELLSQLNEGLKAVIASGEYGQIYDHWFSALDPRQIERALRQRQLVIGLMIAILTALVAAGFVLFFKLEINRKTRSLARSEARYRSLVENLPGVVFSAAADKDQMKLTYVSDGMERLSGYPASDFYGESERRSFIEIVHPEDLETLHNMQKSLRDLNRFEHDFRIITREGQVRWLHVLGRASHSPEGRVSSIDGVLIDATEQRRVAELLTQQQSKMASSARLSALGEMAGGIAHEINNPLAIINLRTHQLSQLARRGDVNAAEATKIASGIEATSIRISKIIKSLQTVARESAQDPFERVSVKAVISDAFELCYQRMRTHGIEIIVDDIPPSLEFECRRVQISQVLINLLNNAFDAIVGLNERFIRISAREVIDDGRPSIEISITDSGLGIPKTTADRIFQPFFTTKGVGKGTGLGLSISKGLIEAHEGHITLDPTADRTRFVIVLPQRHATPVRTARAETLPQDRPTI